MANQPKQILVAEDNRITADVLRFNLQRAGFVVTVIGDREQADALGEKRFDLVIVDYHMPGLSGDELCRRLRGDGVHTEVPILLCSAKCFELDIDQLTEELQLAEIFFKPFSPSEIVACVKKNLHEAEPATI